KTISFSPAISACSLASFAELRSSEWSISRKSPTRVIVFDQPPAADRQYAESLYQEERVISQARANALDKQSVALAELRNLLTAEI
ncbi:hypothetical protein ACC687_39880, partial [Rhizobium ruizarguesonis]